MTSQLDGWLIDWLVKKVSNCYCLITQKIRGKNCGSAEAVV